MINDTIAAVSTPQGLGAVGIVRMSGDKAKEISDKIFSTKEKDRKPNVLYLGTATTADLKDKVLCVYFAAPRSFTGEDVVEFQCHGGRVIVESILKECIRLGARLATNGEFSRRAFLNGKMDLTSVEGMADMINAESVAAEKLAYSQFKGEIYNTAKKLQDELETVIAYVEASFDYPEEDMPAINVPEVTNTLLRQRDILKKLISTYSLGSAVKNGISVAIVGKPNVGKSSLLNAILGYDRAIVTDIAGTTRDVLTSSYTYKGVLFNLFDTAGIRETSDTIEKIGVKIAKNTLEEADIVLAVFDTNTKFSSEDKEILESVKGKKVIVVKNKTDLSDNLGENFDDFDVISVSAKNNENVDSLKERLYELSGAGELLSTESAVISSERQLIALKEALCSIENSILGVKTNFADCLIIDVRNAWEKYGEITGTTATEHIIDTIFSKLCLGK